MRAPALPSTVTDNTSDLILQRLDTIDARLGRIEDRLDRVESDLSELKTDVKEVRSSLAELTGDVRKIEGVLQGAGLPNINTRIGIATVSSAAMVAFFLMLADRFLG